MNYKLPPVRVKLIQMNLISMLLNRLHREHIAMRTKREYKEKYLHYHKKAEEGHADSQFKLGEIYENGKGVAKDCKLAEFWYLKAAQQKHAMALLNLNWMRLKELGIDPNEGHLQSRSAYPLLK